MKKLDEAVAIGEEAVILDPGNVDLLGNLSRALLMAGRLEEPQKSIAAAIKFNQNDSIKNYLSQATSELADGRCPQPSSLADLQSEPEPQKQFWE